VLIDVNSSAVSSIHTGRREQASPDAVAVFEQVLAPLKGKPCWNVHQGHGAFLTLEFGEPSLEIEEPRAPKPGTLPRAARLLRRRSVRVRGAWRLWVYCCHWQIVNRETGRILAHEESTRRTIEKAAFFLDGQALQRVAVSAHPSISMLHFDLGGTLITRALTTEDGDWDGTEEQWMLFEPSGSVLSLCGNGTYSYHPDNTSPTDEVHWPLHTTREERGPGSSQGGTEHERR
jgi:hypothetical protein